MASYGLSSGEASPQMIEHAKQAFWDSLPEEQRRLCLQATSNLPLHSDASSQASMVYQTPRFMPSASNVMQSSLQNYGAMNRTSSAPLMTRSMSNTALDTSLERSTTSNTTWASPAQHFTTDYTFGTDTSMRASSNLQSITEGVTFAADNLVEWNPDDYVHTCIEQPSSSAYSPSLPIDSQHVLTQLTSSLPWSSASSGSTSPSTSSTALSTPITHQSNPMSRQSSYNPHFLDSTSMLRIQSDSSCMLPILSEDVDFSLSYNVDSGTISNCVDGSSFPSSFTGSSASETFLSSTPSLPASAQAFASTEHDKLYLAEDMRRSASTTSSEGHVSDASASSSTCSRQLRREREINAQASRKIAPKASENSNETESQSSNVQMTRIRSQDGSSKTVVGITKTPYVRPQHPKIMCQHCSERPEGFRGTHELDRHIARAHAPTRKAFICVDYSSDKTFLANCKHCRNKKVYGAYYNAAAHLRRAHFHPRKRGRKGKNDEKRGGIGGGDHPPMDYLKMHWIKEVDVDNKPSPSSPNSMSDDDATEPVNNKASYNVKYDAPTYPAQQPMPSTMTPHIAVDSNQFANYGMPMHAGEPCMYDVNPLVTSYDNSSSATADMSSFQFDAYMA